MSIGTHNHLRSEEELLVATVTKLMAIAVFIEVAVGAEFKHRVSVSTWPRGLRRAASLPEVAQGAGAESEVYPRRQTRPFVGSSRAPSTRPRTQYRGHLTTAQAAIDSFDERKAQTLFHLFVEHQTYQVPTLHALSKFGTGPGPEPGMEYMPRSIQRITLNGQGRMDPALRADARIYYAQVLKLVAEMYRAGVPFMAGTDEPVPGFALHQDLEQFVKAGLTPLQASEAATIVPARFLHRDDRAGSIAAGKDADVVLLDDDPTRDIRNTTKIRAVVIRGELLDRAALDGMLAGIKAAVN